MASNRTINNTVYTCEKLPADQGLAFFLRTSKVLEPAKDLLMFVLSGGGTDEEVLAGFFRFVKDMDAAQVHALVIDAASHCRTEGNQPVVIGILTLTELLQVAQYCLEVQFRDFLADSAVGTFYTAPPPQGEPSA